MTRRKQGREIFFWGTDTQRRFKAEGTTETLGGGHLDKPTPILNKR